LPRLLIELLGTHPQGYYVGISDTPARGIAVHGRL